MAWRQPKTDWVQSDHVTHEDLNRIFGNVNILAGSAMKEDYTKNDFLTLQQWNQLISHLRSLELATRVVASAASVTSVTVPGTQMTAQTFNDTETLTQALRERIAYMFRTQAQCRTIIQGGYEHGIYRQTGRISEQVLSDR